MKFRKKIVLDVTTFSREGSPAAESCASGGSQRRADESSSGARASRQVRRWRTSIIIITLLGTILYLSQFHLDFSQDYRKIDGYENIVFMDAWSKQCFRLCAWGLVKTEDYAGFEDHRQYDRNSYEYQLIVEKDQAEWVEQVVSSPDGKYILYVERIYRGTGTTDDEDVYYKVYSVDDDVRTTIFSGFRQFLLVDWK